MISKLYLREKSIYKSISYLAFVTAIIAIFAVISTVFVFSEYNKTKNTVYQYVHLEQAGKLMDKGSDYLTEQVRLCALTGNIDYIGNYFTENYVTQNREKAIALLKINIPGGKVPESIENALQASRKLMTQEFYSMALVANANKVNNLDVPVVIRKIEISPEDKALSYDEKLKRAQSIVFNEEYETKKSLIEYNINTYVSAITKELSDQINLHTKRFKTAEICMDVSVSLLVVTVVITLLSIFRHIVKPLNGFVDSFQKGNQLEYSLCQELNCVTENFNAILSENESYKKEKSEKV